MKTKEVAGKHRLTPVLSDILYVEFYDADHKKRGSDDPGRNQASSSSSSSASSFRRLPTRLLSAMLSS